MEHFLCICYRHPLLVLIASWEQTWYCGVSSLATCWPNGTGFKTCWVCQRASLTLQGLLLLYTLVLWTAGATLRTQLNPESKAPLLSRWETHLPNTWASRWGWGGDLGRLSPWHTPLSCRGVRGLRVFRDQANDIKEGCVGKPCPSKWMQMLPQWRAQVNNLVWLSVEDYNR